MGVDKTQLKVWLSGLISAALSGFAGGVGVMIAEPSTFNFTETGIWSLGKVCAVCGLVGVSNYLKQSPLPQGVLSDPPKTGG